MIWLTSSIGLKRLKTGWPDWNPELAKRAAALKTDCAAIDPEELGRALNREILKRGQAFIDAIMAYRHQNTYRNIDPPPVIWQEGNSCLYDYASPQTDSQSPVILAVPSLVNRSYILDLEEELSFLRFLSSAGIRPLLLDWGEPGSEERHFGLTEYITQRLAHSLTAARNISGQNPVLLGYCMGGSLTIPLAQQRQSDLNGLILMAAPWDFHTIEGEQLRIMAQFLAAIFAPFKNRFDTLPVDVVQTLFTALSPLDTIHKYRRFHTQIQRKDQAEQQAIQSFMILEDWLNDGVPLTAKLAFDCLHHWYLQNETAQGKWQIGSMIVQPDKIELPCLAVIPRKDRIVPPASALCLAETLPHCEILRPELGHIGMVASRRAPDLAWKPVVTWIRNRHAASQENLIPV